MDEEVVRIRSAYGVFDHDERAGVVSEVVAGELVEGVFDFGWRHGHTLQGARMARVSMLLAWSSPRKSSTSGSQRSLRPRRRQRLAACTMVWARCVVSGPEMVGLRLRTHSRKLRMCGFITFQSASGGWRPASTDFGSQATAPSSKSWIQPLSPSKRTPLGLESI